MADYLFSERGCVVDQPQPLRNVSGVNVPVSPSLLHFCIRKWELVFIRCHFRHLRRGRKNRIAPTRKRQPNHLFCCAFAPRALGKRI